MFALAAAMGGICYGLQRRLLLWRRRGRDWEVVGDRIWNHLRKFSGWMCTGCAAGVVIYAANMRANDLFFESRIPGIADVQRYELLASFDRSRAVVRIFFTVQLSCFIFAMNLLLRRLSDHASHSYYNEARDHDDDGSKRFDWRDCVGQYKLYYLVRSMHAVAMLLCAFTQCRELFWLHSLPRERGFTMRPRLLATLKAKIRGLFWTSAIGTTEFLLKM